MATTSYSPELDEIKIFFSPAKALERMNGVYEMAGIKTGITSSTFQPQRESWASALFLLGYGQLTHSQYWLRENPHKHLAPDIFSVTFRTPTSEQKGISREVMELEVCEYDDHAIMDIAGHITAKLKDKSYNEHTFLLCYIHKKQATRLIDVIEGLKDMKTSVREIWLLYHLHYGEEGNFGIARVYLRNADLKTTNFQYKGNYLELMKNPQLEMVHVSKGLAKEIEFDHLGIAYVPLPRIKKKK